MVCMRVRNQNRIGSYTLNFAIPIRAAIDHYSLAAPGNQQPGVHSMQRCSCRDISSRSKMLVSIANFSDGLYNAPDHLFDLLFTRNPQRDISFGDHPYDMSALSTAGIRLI